MNLYRYRTLRCVGRDINEIVQVFMGVLGMLSSLYYTKLQGIMVVLLYNVEHNYHDSPGTQTSYAGY